VPSPAYDLNKARALLKEAGYKGEEIEMLGSMGGTQELEIATVQAQLKKIGMNIKIKMAERGANVQNVPQGPIRVQTLRRSRRESQPRGSLPADPCL